MERETRRIRWLAGAVGVIFIAVLATLLIEGSGSSDSPAFSYSVNEARKPCSGGSFLPEKSAQRFLDRPPPKKWRVVQDYPGSVFANSELVELHLRGGSSEEVTLKAVRFHIERRRRPKGVTLYPSCFSQLHGWLMITEFDEQRPKAVIYNHDDPEERIVPLPWTISLEEPFTLLIQPNTSHCYCAWTAEIPWVRGSEHGTILIAEGKKDFEITYTGGMPAHSAEKNGWS